MDFFDIAVIGLFIVIPTIILVWFIVSLVLYIKRDESDEFSCDKRKNSLMISGICLLVLTVLVAVVLFKIGPEINNDIDLLSNI